jgi:hypothetical protein
LDLQLSGIFSLIEEGRVAVEWIMLNPRLAGVLKWNGIRIKLMDIATWVGVTITAVHEWYGLECEEHERWPSGFNSEWEVLNALVNDLLTWAETYTHGILNPTLGKTAFDLWRQHYAPDDVDTVSDNGRDTFLLPCFGQDIGRNAICDAAIVQPNVTLGKTGTVEGPIYDLDVKSFYPSLYLGKGQPTKLIVSSHKCDLAGLKYLVERYWVCAKVSLLHSKWKVPTFPGNKLRWQHAPCETVASGEELKYYLEAGAITGIKWVVAYTTADYLSDFGQAVIKDRDLAEKQGKVAHAAYTKKIANSLWGRFAPQRERWEVIKDAQALVPWGEWYVRNTETGETVKRRAIGNVVQQQYFKGWGSKSWPACAAFVCAEARIFINALCEGVGDENVLYKVVDGLHVTKAGFANIASRITWDNSTPGQLRISGIYSRVTYHGLYSWEHGEGWSIAGLPRNAIRESSGRYRGILLSGPAESHALGDLNSVFSRERLFNYTKHPSNKLESCLTSTDCEA